MSDPKMFISYSWTNPDHEAWVVDLAEELVSQGIDVILDKWNLQPGHDAIAFMESMVTDPTVTKVLLICDRKYAEKSNTRSGGAGTEAQIITPELYAKRAQDKFVAVVRERDDEGKPVIPAYYKGRIFIDLSDPTTYATEFERLLRWAWDRPLHVKPEPGKKPSFLNEDSSSIKMATSVPFRRAIDSIKNNRDSAVPATVEYFDTVISELEKFCIAFNGAEFDDLVTKSIGEFLPYRNEITELFLAIASYRPDSEMIEAVHRFFERLLPFTYPPPNKNQWHEVDFDNLKFIMHELFLCCLGAFIKSERFVAAAYFVETEYYFADDRSRETMHSYVVFGHNPKSLQFRNQRLKLNRLSLHADLLNERAKSSGLDFKYLMAADFVLWLRSQYREVWHGWWPDTLVFVSFRSGLPFEMFARAKSVRYFEKIKPFLGVDDTAGLERLLGKIEAEPNRIPRWEFDRMNPRALLQMDAIASTP
jgi:hypothetical protein